MNSHDPSNRQGNVEGNGELAKLGGFFAGAKLSQLSR